MLELRFMHTGKPVALLDLPARVGRAKAAREVGDTIEGLIAFLDELGGDPDLEADADLEPSGDEQDTSWPEWHTRGRDKLYDQAEAPRTGPAWRAIHEDDEDDDPREDDDEDMCLAGDDRVAGGLVVLGALGFPRQQPSYPGDAEDAEREGIALDPLEMRLEGAPISFDKVREARHGD